MCPVSHMDNYKADYMADYSWPVCIVVAHRATQVPHCRQDQAACKEHPVVRKEAPLIWVDNNTRHLAPENAPARNEANCQRSLSTKGA